MAGTSESAACAASCSVYSDDSAGLPAGSDITEITVILQDQRYFASSQQHPEFFKRAQGTFFQACICESTSRLLKKSVDGSFVLQEEHFPRGVVDLFPEIWSYMLTGTWPRPLLDVSAIRQKSAAFEFLSITDPDKEAYGDRCGNIVFHRYLMQLPDDFHDRVCCGLIEDNAMVVGPAYDQFDAVGEAKTTELTTAQGSVSLGFNSGCVYVKLPSSCRYVYATEHPLLKHKIMLSLVVRPYRSEHRRFESGIVLFLKVAPRRHAEASIQGSPVATWPACWFVASCRQVDGSFVLESLSTEVLEGMVSTMKDGTVAVVSHPHNLRKACLSLYPASDGVVTSPPLLVNLVAPSPPQSSTPSWRKGGVYKGRGKSGPGKFSKAPLAIRDAEQRVRHPFLLTHHPHGRAPKHVWLAACGKQLVVVIHAVDGRVAVAQVAGKGGCIPELPRPLGKQLHWDVWCRTRDELITSPRSTRRRMRLRRRFAVPVCREVLAVLPREREVVIVCRLKAGECPSLWRVPLNGESSDSKANMVTAFTGSFHDAKGLRKGAGKGRAVVTGDWIEHEWFSHVSGKLPGEIMDDPSITGTRHVCEAFDGVAQQPIFDFHCWQLVPPDAKPIIDHQESEYIVGKRTRFTGGKSGVRLEDRWTHFHGPSPSYECELACWTVQAMTNAG